MESESLSPDEEQVLKEILGETPISKDANLDDLRDRMAEDFALADTLFGRSAKLSQGSDGVISPIVTLPLQANEQEGLGIKTATVKTIDEPKKIRTAVFQRTSSWLALAASLVVSGILLFLTLSGGPKVDTTPLQHFLTAQVSHVPAKIVHMGGDKLAWNREYAGTTLTLTQPLTGEQFSYPIMALPVKFQQGTAVLLDDESNRVLKAWASLLQSATTRGHRFALEGFADVSSDESRNQELSQQRAEAIRQIFVRDGVDESAFPRVEGVGSLPLPQISAFTESDGGVLLILQE